MADLGSLGYMPPTGGVQVVDDAMSWNIANNPIFCYSQAAVEAVPKREDWKTISGDVADATSAPLARVVRVIERSTGQVIGETTSSESTGAYSIPVPFAVEVQVVCLDDAAGTTENDLIHRSTPV